MTCIKEFKFLFSNSKKFKLFNILGELKCLMPYCLYRRQSGTEELRRHRLRPDSVLDGAIPRGGGPRPETDQLMAEGKALLHGLIHSPRLWRAIQWRRYPVISAKINNLYCREKINAIFYTDS